MPARDTNTCLYPIEISSQRKSSWLFAWGSRSEFEIACERPTFGGSGFSILRGTILHSSGVGFWSGERSVILLYRAPKQRHRTPRLAGKTGRARIVAVAEVVS